MWITVIFLTLYFHKWAFLVSVLLFAHSLTHIVVSVYVLSTTFWVRIHQTGLVLKRIVKWIINHNVSFPSKHLEYKQFVPPSEWDTGFRWNLTGLQLLETSLLLKTGRNLFFSVCISLNSECLWPTCSSTLDKQFVKITAHFQAFDLKNCILQTFFKADGFCLNKTGVQFSHPTFSIRWIQHQPLPLTGGDKKKLISWHVGGQLQPAVIKVEHGGQMA